MLKTPMRNTKSNVLNAKSSDGSPDRDATTFDGLGGRSEAAEVNKMRSTATSACGTKFRVSGALKGDRTAFSAQKMSTPARPATAIYYKKIADIKNSANNFATNKALQDHLRKQKMLKSAT